jgi:NAD(P)H-hydrate epimerase
MSLILHDGLAYLTSDEMREADQEAITEFGIGVLSLMENAGSAVASTARMLLGGSAVGKKVGVLSGKGNNGGDGLVAARHLHNWGAEIRVLLSDSEALGPVPSGQLKAVKEANVSVQDTRGSIDGLDLLVDSLLGYNARGNPREPIRGMILRANASMIPILAVDLPSGLDATTGECNDPCVMAKATLTLGFPKTGFLNPDSRKCIGRLYLADVSLPLEVYKKRSQDLAPFEKESVIRIW